MSAPTDEWPKVVENEDDVCVYLGPGRVQLRAVRVGKGIEVTLSDRGQRLCRLPYCKTLVVDPVFVVLPAVPDLRCRTCGGTGADYSKPLSRGPMEPAPCAPCDGTGVSPVYAATWQFRSTLPGADWTGGYNAEGIQSWEYLCERGQAERRQVVEWRATDVTVLPVVKMIGTWTDTFPCIEVLGGGTVSLCTVHESGGVEQRFLDEPWAADLRPGQFVLRLDGWEHLQQPHTEMRRTLRSGGDYGGAFNDLPLSVPDGVLSWMELTP